MSLPACYTKLGTIARQLDHADVSVCALFNRLSHQQIILAIFRIVSRLGDGVIWYTIMVSLPFVAGYDGALISLHMGATALAGLLLYKLTKRFSGRERPYVMHAGRIACAMPPLDRYSFPSGHTLHAVCFTMVLHGYLPATIWILLPLSLLVALSRVILGLHYPSDVLAGASIGGLLAVFSLDLSAMLGMPVYQ
jgi:undecaprenyl-diphosphatase